MKKEYAAPIVEKITFDYKIQTAGSKTNCFGSVINTATAESVCGEGTPSYIGWNDPHPEY